MKTNIDDYEILSKTLCNFKEFKYIKEFFINLCSRNDT